MIVNGDEMNLDENITVIELLDKLNINLSKVVVEVNFNIIPKENYKDTILKSDSKVELIQFVGGG